MIVKFLVFYPLYAIAYMTYELLSWLLTHEFDVYVIQHCIKALGGRRHLASLEVYISSLILDVWFNKLFTSTVRCLVRDGILLTRVSGKLRHEFASAINSSMCKSKFIGYLMPCVLSYMLSAVIGAPYDLIDAIRYYLLRNSEVYPFTPLPIELRILFIKRYFDLLKSRGS